MNTYIVEGGIGKCTAFTSLIPKLKQKSEVQIYTPYIPCFANNPDVKLVLEQSLPLQDPRIMASDNIYYCEPYKSNFQFGKQHIIESYCENHGVEFDVNMKPKLYTTIINCVLPNEPHFNGTIRCDLHWSEIHELLKGAEGFISIDSCLQHFSASAEKHGVVIWGSTRWTQFGYSHNKNLQFHMKDKWIEEKFIDSDPRNNMVEPKLIIDEYKKLDKNKPVALATI